MKPIAIIAIIAAVVVVGGACAGVAFSGVLNGGTTGPEGDDPVVPTDPVDPTPTETPTETPTPTPTDSSMSYFNPMTSSGSSSGSSGGSGSSTPACEHGEWTYSVLEGDKHTKTCGLCSDYSVVEECSPLDQYVIDEDYETHQQKCKHCEQLIGTATSCTFTKYGSEPQYDYKPIDGSKHQKVCSVCNHNYIKICVGSQDSPITPVPNTLKHSGSCIDCGANYEEGVDCSFVNMTADSATQHHSACEVCGGSDNENSRTTYDNVDCTWEFKKGDSDYKHTEFCGYCENKRNENQDCTYNTESATDNQNGTHTINCDDCNEPQTFECSYGETKTPTSSGEGTGTHYWVCTANGCESKKVEECNTFDISQKDGDKNVHIKSCKKCTQVLDAEEPCDFKKDEESDNQYLEKCECGREVVSVYSLPGLVTYINKYAAKDAGNNAINIMVDIEFGEDDTWTPANLDGYNGADVITINGNGHTITGLTAPLFAGGFAGGSGIVINDLTIAASTIVSTNTLGSGAFIETIDSMDTITLNNCHLKDSTVTGSRTGGLIGWNSGYDNVNDGSVKTIVTITDCTVINCKITGDGTVGGIVGHAGANAWTWNTIENCKVENCELTSNDDSYRVGAIVGTANIGEVIITDCTSKDNTIKQNNAGTEILRPDGQSDLYGRFVPSTTGKLTINGVAIN